MNSTEIARQRFHNQRLTSERLATATDVVAWMGAMQAQDFMGALWAVGSRMGAAGEADVEAAFASGAILRTHIMRPTWHFVAPADIRWLQMLTAPRVHAINTTYLRQLELDPPLVTRCIDLMVKVLEGGKQLTRAELGAALAQGGIEMDSFRLGFVISVAELDAILVSGGRRGKQFTYALLDERAPQGVTLTRDEALAELTLRYLRSHGWATERDFAWWSGLTLSDVRAGIELVRTQLVSETVEGQTYWMTADAPRVGDAATGLHLLMGFDEYLIGYTDRSAALREEHYSAWAGNNAVFSATIVDDGQVIGTWKRTLKSKTVHVEVSPFAPLTAEQQAAFAARIADYGRFVGREVVIM
jgi:hypothetical protein